MIVACAWTTSRNDRATSTYGSIVMSRTFDRARSVDAACAILGGGGGGARIDRSTTTTWTSIVIDYCDDGFFSRDLCDRVCCVDSAMKCFFHRRPSHDCVDDDLNRVDRSVVVPTTT